ncbi:FTR1 family iron permease [Sporosarcina aquimarina]|uniref:FTR1 family protein n=1 Tax=Sporosarcina aquimarina TaxID=114975 RepID=A0ABU4FXX1_9BACL|nr:FTR1 family protein [Sporosarcina aquimarina]MDW0109496.1 FTR1 family protein [Sporosarcina aquimarina]
MNPYSKLCKQALLIAVLLLSLLPASLARAEAPSYSDLYIAIGDAIMASKQDDTTASDTALEEFKATWQQKDHPAKESKQVESALKDAEQAKGSAQRLEALTVLSKALHALEKAENPVDEQAERLAFEKAVTPDLEKLGDAIQSGDIEAVRTSEKKFLATWTRNERPVREQSISAYGTIETQMAFLRIALAEDAPSQTDLEQTYTSLEQAITSFAAGEMAQGAAPVTDDSLDTLTSLLADSRAALAEGDADTAVADLREFIMSWPNVEGQIRTKDAALYTKIESQIPLLAGKLTSPKADSKKISSDIASLQQQIELVKESTSYTFWDSALILLREGLEALLIIIGLVAFLKKAGQPQLAKWIYTGSAVGITASIVAAVLMTTILNSVTIGSSREIMEGVIGLAAAAMMIGMGAWLHRKSSVTAWNDYIARQMGTAVSSKSAWAIGLLSFLTVFREGAETVVFYVGIAPNMNLSEFLLGIAVALVILVAVAVVLLKAGNRIPIHRLFAVATVFIYILAFKIIGVSIHTLQLTDIFPTSIVDGLPVAAAIGFYPTWETLAGQLVLVVTVVAMFAIKKRLPARSAVSS